MGAALDSAPAGEAPQAKGDRAICDSNRRQRPKDRLRNMIVLRGVVRAVQCERFEGLMNVPKRATSALCTERLGGSRYTSPRFDASRNGGSPTRHCAALVAQHFFTGLAHQRVLICGIIEPSTTPRDERSSYLRSR